LEIGAAHRRGWRITEGRLSQQVSSADVGNGKGQDDNLNKLT